ncbi:arabinose efflux permease family protein [Desulfosporosinus orientis DSM 765]|uniref:Arabinose efflux permease family protein n=1 Tax=Desulfosporosinus orientis (strain ATCC 19365 / DSM 765 / NCIMB 8382 / VKM B-1628 / Singapore I) TaxID=768706 RepID=G7WFQ5_DESOD|nr:MFS transporter [Desulfosporosinus orientis]AET68928.1 arabinose efflux permease family protein [Desulfosporosinus orientis DSM 765]
MNFKQPIEYSTIGVLSLAHMLNDMYSNYLPQMLPFLVAATGLSATRAAILVSAFTISSSFIQPLFGYFLDRQGKRWLVHVGTIWMAIMLSLTGLVTNYLLLVLLAGLAGLGTAAFHPQASTMITVVSGDRKAVLLSTFIAFGNIGFALSPLLLVPLFQTYGLSASVYTVIPGILVALLLYFFAPKNNVLGGRTPSLKEVIQSLQNARAELLTITSVIAIRALAYTGLLTILPLYFQAQKLSSIASSHLVFIMLFSGAIGGILGGYLSDRYGRKLLIVSSLSLATPLFYGFLNTQGTLSSVFLALAGASLLSSFSVTVVAAQEAIPNNKSLAAGLTMGFAGGIGGLMVIIIGQIGDLYGLSTAISVLFFLPLVAGAIALLMKSRPTAKSERMAVQ